MSKPQIGEDTIGVIPQARIVAVVERRDSAINLVSRVYEQHMQRIARNFITLRNCELPALVKGGRSSGRHPQNAHDAD